MPFDDSVFEDDDLKLLMDVAVFYNDFSTSRMEIMAFAHGGPWEQVYSQGEDLAVIEKDVITEYHSKFDRVPDYKAYMFSMLQRSCGMIRSTEDAVRHDESTAIYSQNGSSKA